MTDKLLVVVGLLALVSGCVAGHGSGAGAAPPPEPVAVHPPLTGQQSMQVDFAAEVLPVLETGCTPCHFEGGKMYAALPFDRADTVIHLGESLLTRIDEPEQEALIRRFLAQEEAVRGRGEDVGHAPVDSAPEPTVQ